VKLMLNADSMYKGTQQNSDSLQWVHHYSNKNHIHQRLLGATYMEKSHINFEISSGDFVLMSDS